MVVLFLYLTLVHTTTALTANPQLMYELCTHAPVTTVNKTSITGNINPTSVQYKHNDNKTKTHQILSSKYYLSSDIISLFNNALSTVKTPNWTHKEFFYHAEVT
jgi:hypothetical protein